ncbi:SIMPL domain-containing protein [Sphingomonas sp. HITSZ_GF]|uniref:SIMPL domain-containing protein n=1 Tax=Sphingomonas sp. HITSZ_GF TaxID=3037247 RepID=UPI00240E664E|nr:SIMPL domain-containing protein [Sphingomonas sp. HITSZ_GF]MDG2532439.1 SIMPL domain-containing protein [Sphingomonas sp. HITSZ_GF]
MLRYALAFAVVALPQAAMAQSAPVEGPVTVEIVATGQVKVPANRFRFSVTVTGKGANEKAAEVALAANRAKLIQALTVQGIREGKPLEGAGNGNSLASLFSAFAGRGKTSFSLDLGDENEKSQSTASETLMFDAPTRAGALAAKPTVEANGGKMADEVIGLLDDYAGPTRRAKADAIAKARGEAAGYAETLGLRRAAIARISEKQDMVAGSMSFFLELISMFAPKPAGASDSVTVTANLAVEFQLSR